MTFKCRFNATCFLFKINRFVLIFSKTSNRFVLKICSGGFADYILLFPYLYSINFFLYLLLFYINLLFDGNNRLRNAIGRPSINI